MAKVWFYNIPFHGHVNPTLPLLRELVRRGDEVTYYSSPAFEKAIAATGARYRAYENLRAFEKSRSVTHIIHLGKLVADTTYALLPEVLSAVATEKPDYLIFDMSAPWGGVASRRYGIPALASFPHLPFYWRTVFNDKRVLRKAVQSIKPGYGYWRQLQQQTAKIIKDFKLRDPKDINVLSSSAELNLVFSTRYFQPYERHFDKSYLYVGPEIETERQEEPLEIKKDEGQLLIYVAVGTVYRANLQFFQHCLQAFDDKRYSVILSVGQAVNPADLGSVPQNFTVAQYVPQLAVLENADVFITHGGMNSISEAVYYGVPMIVVPNTIEQALNAVRIEQLHAGIYLEPDRLSPGILMRAVESMVADQGIINGIDKIKQSFHGAGGVSRAADAIQIFKQQHGIA